MNAPYTTVTELQLYTPDRLRDIIRFIVTKSKTELAAYLRTDKGIVFYFEGDHQLSLAKGDFIGLTNNGEICKLDGNNCDEVGQLIEFPEPHQGHLF